MGEKRFFEVPVKPVVNTAAVVLAILAGGAFLTRKSWLPLVGATVEAPAPETDPVAARAEEIAVAVTSVDYRDPQGFLACVRPLASDRAYEQLRAAFFGLAWAGFELQELVIRPEQVTATDQGLAGRGAMWQARWVHVLIVDPPAGQAADRDLIVQLVDRDGEWLLQDLLSDEQLHTLIGLPTSAAPEPTPTALPSVEQPSPSAGEDLASFVAREFARAYAAVDYREQGIWLARLHSLATPDGYAFLQFVVLPEFWPTAEAMQLVIPYEEVVVEDLGLVSQGETALEAWQVRRVAVTYRVAGAEGAVSDAFRVRVVQPIDADHDDLYGGWRASAIESERGRARGGGS